MWKAERKGQAVEECTCLEDFMVGETLSVYIRNHEGSLPDYARPESVRVFCSVWVKGAGHEDLSGVLSIGGVLFIFFFFQPH